MYKPTNILVTGGCGFIGSNTINYLLSKYDDIFIINIDKLNYCSSVDNVDYHKNYKFIKGDIKSDDLINNILNTYNIDTIINFAAQSHVDNSFNNSLEFTKDNILGTHTLLECTRLYGNIKRFIHVSTDEVYGEVDDNTTSKEISLLNPTNPYAATKAGAEFLVKAYYLSFNIPIIITRGNNVYGPRQYPEKLIPKFINNLLNNEKCPIHGMGNTRRNFLYVDDVSNAFDIILHKGVINEIYNIGTDDEYSVMNVLKILVKEINNSNDITNYYVNVKDRDFNDSRYSINSEKLLNLGWQKKINFEEGIKLTINWYRKNNNLYYKMNLIKNTIENF